MGAFALCASLLLLLSSLALFCAANDRLLPDQSLPMNQSLVSNGGKFALGFFSLGATPSRHYLGIWYNDTDMPVRTVVWVANRENPFTDSSVVLRIANQSNRLVVSNSAGRVLWSSNSSGTPPPRGSMAAVLLDTGNLVLKATESDVRWQSFDHPVDTILPGMKLWIEKKLHFANKIVSWKAADDPSPGAFSYGIDPATTLQTMVWNGTLPYRRTCVWDTSQTRGGPMTAIGHAATFSIQRNDETANITFSPSADASVIPRIVIDRTGEVQLFYWNSSTNNWASLLWYPAAKPCDNYRACGPFGVCRNTGSSRVCDCLDGYEPRVQSEWSRGAYFGGCVRQRAPACDTGDGFQRMANMKIPDKMVYLHGVMNESACEAACRGNCSCVAYAYASSVQSYLHENISRCLVWVGEMIDLVQYTAAEGEDFYLRVPRAGTVNKTRMLWLVLPPVLLALILCVSLHSCWKYREKIKGWRCKNGKRTRYASMAYFSGFSRGDAQKQFSGPRDLLEDEQKDGQESDLRIFSFDAVAAATDNFSDANKLGQGGFGDVYRGVLPCGQKIAVKRLSMSSGQGLDEFKTEVVLIAKLQHRNLVRLLGCCIEGEEKILIYEYMPNKSLDFFLFDSARRSMLDWSRRFDIIEGIARGLLYLHRDSRVRVVHRDMKASNILLDGEMSPKISDFGMARIFGGNQNFDSTNRVVGTFGYMPPEYAMEGLFSVKSDVYSFGVLMLEIVSGRKNNRSGLGTHTNVLGYAWQLWTVGRAEEIVDPCIRGSCSMQQVLRCVHIGLLCVQDRPYDRPTMSSVVVMLGSEAGINQMPKQPIFAVEGSPNETDSLKYDADSYSVNSASMSIVTGR